MISKKTILIIGAGNIGSRHLQGLKKVKYPLNITVLDPSNTSLESAATRYNQAIGSKTQHNIVYKNFLSDINHKKIELVIIATSSDVRRKVTEDLFKCIEPKYIIFEKLLFQKYEDFIEIENLLKKNRVKSWVNCSMRSTPFYSNLKKEVIGSQLMYTVYGLRDSLVTNAIHFIDHMAYLTDCYNFSVDTKLLNKNLIKSKRKGFLECTGSLIVNFENGSIGIFVDSINNNSPILVEITNENFRALANETTRRTWLLKPPQWVWKETKNSLLFQSDMTNAVVEQILKSGKCELTPYTLSSKIHLILLESLKKFINSKSSKKFDYYPFT